MSFGRIRADLAALEQKIADGGQITAADVWGSIRDLCEDIRSDTGSAVEQKPPGDANGLLRQLPWMGRLVTRQYGRIRDQVMDLGRQEELNQKIRELEALSEQMEVLSGENSVLEDKKSALLSQQAKLEAQSKKKLELQKTCEMLKERIQVLSESSIPLMEQQQAELQRESDALSQQYTQLKDELSQKTSRKKELESQISQEKSIINDAHVQCWKLEQQYQDLYSEQINLTKQCGQAQEKLELVKAQLEDSRSALREYRDEQLPNAQEELDQTRSALEDSRDLLQKLQQEAQDLENQCRDMEEEKGTLLSQLQDLAQRKKDLQQLRQDNLQELERLREVLRQLDTECASLQQQLDQLTNDLSGKDREQIKQRLSDSIRQKQEALNEFHELEIRIQDIQLEAQEQARKNEAAIQQQQELKWQADRENQKAADRILELQQELGNLRMKREQLRGEEASLQAQSDQLEGWLRSLELGQYTQRLEKMRQRNRQLLEARIAIEEDLKRLMEVRGITTGELDMSLFEASFRNTEEWILHYQKLIGDTIRLLGSGEDT